MSKLIHEEPSNVIMSDVARSEVKLREAVAELNIDTPLVRAFLEKTAKEYLKVFGYKGKIVRIDAPHFFFQVRSVGGTWNKKVRVPATDFFIGKSSVAQRDYKLRQILRGDCDAYSVVEKEAHLIQKARKEKKGKKRK
jgi:hypothetical protein